MRALRDARPVASFSRRRRRAMAAQGLPACFRSANWRSSASPPSPRKLPMILRASARPPTPSIAANPDVLVIIDSPDFTHRVARRVRERCAGISRSSITCRPRSGPGGRGARAPCAAMSIMCWRSCRSSPRRIARLGGPHCTYVGHPLASSVARLRPNAEEARRRAGRPAGAAGAAGKPEQRNPPAGGRVRRGAWRWSRERVGPLEVVLPTRAASCRRGAARRPRLAVRPRIVIDRTRNMRRSARRGRRSPQSGTVDARTGAGRRADGRGVSVQLLEELIGAPADHGSDASILANLVLGENVVPEFLQRGLHAARRSPRPCYRCLADTPERRRQLEAFARLDAIMEIGRGRPQRPGGRRGPGLRRCAVNQPGAKP